MEDFLNEYVRVCFCEHGTSLDVDVDVNAVQRDSMSSGAGGSGGREQRRSSFLYRSDDDDVSQASTSVAHSHHSSIAAGSQCGANDSVTGDEATNANAAGLLITPYAQILACLRQVLDNYNQLTISSEKLQPTPAGTLSSLLFSILFVSFLSADER